MLIVLLWKISQGIEDGTLIYFFLSTCNCSRYFGTLPRKSKVENIAPQHKKAQKEWHNQGETLEKHVGTILD